MFGIKKGLLRKQTKQVNHAVRNLHGDSCKCYISEIYLILVQIINPIFIQIGHLQLTRCVSTIMIWMQAYIASRF